MCICVIIIRNGQRMKFLYGVFIGVMAVLPNLAHGAGFVTHTVMWDVEDTPDAGGQDAYDEYMKGLFCKDGAGAITVGENGIEVLCESWKSTEPADADIKSAHGIALCRAQCAENGEIYVSGTGGGDCRCRPAPSQDPEIIELEASVNRQVASRTNRQINRDVNSLVNEADQGLVDSVENEIRGQKLNARTVASVEKSTDKSIAASENDFSSQIRDELRNQKSDLRAGAKESDATRDVLESEMKNPDLDQIDKDLASQERLSDKELSSQIRDELRNQKSDLRTGAKESDAAMSELTAAVNRDVLEGEMKNPDIDQIDSDVAKMNEDLDKQLDKQLECESRNPPMGVKKNALGLWVCTETEDTIAAREQKKANNKALKAFWDDIDDIERAFNRRVRQLRRVANADNGGDQ